MALICKIYSLDISYIRNAITPLRYGPVNFILVYKSTFGSACLSDPSIIEDLHVTTRDSKLLMSRRRIFADIVTADWMALASTRSSNTFNYRISRRWC